MFSVAAAQDLTIFKGLEMLRTLFVLLALLPSCLLAQDLPDGLNLDNIDSVVRVRNNQGSGTGSVYKEDDQFYWVMTNYHVAGKVGDPNTIDIWNNGRIVKSVSSRVEHSFYARDVNKDIAILKIPKTALPGTMPVIPLAAERSDCLKVGDSVWQVGCDAGNWTNAERGVVLAISNGVVYYQPYSIPGNSGGPLYSADCSKQLGVTTWVAGPLMINGKQYKSVGLAQTYDRVWDIVQGRVNSDAKLPTSAKQIPLAPKINDADLLPTTAAAIPLAKAETFEPVQCCPGGNCPQAARSWRSPGASTDGRVDPRSQGGGGLFGLRKQQPDPKSILPNRGGPLGFGVFDGSIMDSAADVVGWIAALVLSFLGFAFVVVVILLFMVINQTLGPGWLRDLWMAAYSFIGSAMGSLKTAITPKAKALSPEAQKQLAEFERWRREQSEAN